MCIMAYLDCVLGHTIFVIVYFELVDADVHLPGERNFSLPTFTIHKQLSQPSCSIYGTMPGIVNSPSEGIVDQIHEPLFHDRLVPIFSQ